MASARSSIIRSLRLVGQHVEKQQSREMSSSRGLQRKVTILGAAGGIGQPLGLLMKLNPLVTHLSLYDIAGTPGVAADISHCNTPAEVWTLTLHFMVEFFRELSSGEFFVWIGLWSNPIHTK